MCLVVCLSAVLAGCVPVTGTDGGGPDTSTDTGTSTGPGLDSGTDGPDQVGLPQFGATTAAQEALGPPVVALARGILDLARRADFVRHDVERGEPQSDALDDLGAVQALLDQAVTDLEGVRESLGPQDVPAAADDVITELIDEARDVARQVQTDLDDLDPFVAFDAALGNIVQAWAVRGSRSEFAERLEELVVQSEAVVGEARRLPSSPVGCTDLRTNRIRWAQVVRTRTAELRDVAVGGDGTAYDELRDRYDRAPYGEDRTVADAESRSCWLDRTSLQEAPARVDVLLSRMEQALT